MSQDNPSVSLREQESTGSERLAGNPVSTDPTVAQEQNVDANATKSYGTPIKMEASGIVLDDHEVPSVNPYVLQDLKVANKADIRDWCTMFLGKDEASLEAWQLQISQQNWFHDEVIQQAFIDYCTISSETARYEPFTRLANRLVHLARGNLSGVRKKNSYPIDDIWFAVHYDRPVAPIPEHGIIAAERKPDVVIASKADCNAVLVTEEKLRLRWPQIISFIEFKATKHIKNLKKALDNKRLAEGLPLIRHREEDQKTGVRTSKKKAKKTTGKRPTRRQILGKIPAVVLGGASTKEAERAPKAVRAGMKRKLDELEPDDPIPVLDVVNSEREKDPKAHRIRVADAAAQVGSYGLELMSGTRGTRTSCFSASISDDRMWLWHYSPTGIVYTNKSISIIAHFEVFAAIVVAFASCCAEQFGALPCSIIQTPDSGPTVLLREDLFGHKLTLSHPTTKDPVTLMLTKHVFTQYGLTGRRTFVYEADPCPSDGLSKVIVKFSYQASGRRPEYELIENARKNEVSHLPDVHMWGDIWTLQDVARENHRLAKQRSIEEDEYALVEPEYEDRIFRVIVYSRYYSVRTLFTKHIEVMPLMADQVLDCLHDLRYKASMLHRDISVNNIMWHVCDGKLDFKVIDFDMAIVDANGEDYVPSSKHRAGTLPFMAPELLYDVYRCSVDENLTVRKPVRHLLRHDFASLFYVCIWCVEVLLGHELTATEQQWMRQRARNLERGGLEAIADYKMKLLRAEYEDWNFKLPPSAQCLLDWLLEAWQDTFDEALRNIRREGNRRRRGRIAGNRSSAVFDDETGGGLLTRDNLKAILVEMIPSSTRTCTVADIERDCIPTEVDGPSIPLELRKQVKAGKRKTIKEKINAATESIRSKLRPRKNGKAVIAPRT